MTQGFESDGSQGTVLRTNMPGPLNSGGANRGLSRERKTESGGIGVNRGVKRAVFGINGH